MYEINPLKKLLKKEIILSNKDCVSEPHTQYYTECKNNNSIFSNFGWKIRIATLHCSNVIWFWVMVKEKEMEYNKVKLSMLILSLKSLKALTTDVR